MDFQKICNKKYYSDKFPLYMREKNTIKHVEMLTQPLEFLYDILTFKVNLKYSIETNTIKNKLYKCKEYNKLLDDDLETELRWVDELIHYYLQIVKNKQKEVFNFLVIMNLQNYIQFQVNNNGKIICKIDKNQINNPRFKIVKWLIEQKLIFKFVSKVKFEKLILNFTVYNKYDALYQNNKEGKEYL